MHLVNSPRPYDDLSSFGTLIRFTALVFDNVAEGESCGAFEPYNIDGDVVFPLDRESADRAFDAWVDVLKAEEPDFVADGENEGFVALFETPKGLMILAGTNIMAYANPDLTTLLPGAKHYLGMPHVTWERILDDVKP